MISAIDLPQQAAPQAVLVRQRLLRKLQHGSANRVTVMHALAGCGKRTLAQHYLAACNTTAQWLTMQPAHRDFSTFHSALLAALREHVPGVEALAADDPEEAALALAGALREGPQQPLLLVLEDAHVLAGAAPVEAWLRIFALQLPGRLGLMLLCHTPPALPLAELSARRLLRVIGQQELRFTHDEVLALAAARGTPAQLPPTALLRRLQGWATGVSLALQPLPPDVLHTLLQPEWAGSPQAQAVPLAQAVLDALPHALRDFLLRASTLPHFTPALLQQALGLPDADAHLSEAGQRALVPPPAAGELRLAAPLREVLQHALQRTQPALFCALHEQAADWFARHDQPDAAFTHLMSAGQAEAAWRTAESAAPACYRDGQHELLLGWQQALAPAHPAGPRLLFACAAALADRGENMAALAALDKAAPANAAADSKTLLLRARVLLGVGNAHAAIVLCQRVLESPKATAVHGRALALMGEARLAQGETRAALQLMREAAAHARQKGATSALDPALHTLQAVLLRLGQIDEASACLDELVALRRAHSPGSALARALCAWGRCRLLQGDYARARQALSEGMQVAARRRDHRAEAALLHCMGDLLRDLGQLHDAWQVYNRALELTPEGDHALRCRILMSTAVLRRWMGQLEDAAAIAREAQAQAEAHDLQVEAWLARALRWAAAGMRGQRAAAREQVLLAAEELHGLQAHSEAALAHVLCAGLALPNSPTAAAASLRDAAQALRGGGSPHPAAAETAQLPTEIGALLAEAGQPAAVLLRALVALRHASIAQPQAPAHRVLPAPAFIHSLRLHTLGRERVERDGVLIPSNAWRAVVSRELLLYLVMRGGRQRKEICEEFWPDKTPQRLRFIFHTTVHRLRHTVGENLVVLDGERYQVNADVDLWCDAHTLQALLVRARAQPARGPEAEALYRRAVDLYLGEFLPQFDTEWVSAVRESLQRLHRESLIGLARCAFERQAFHEAEHHFQRLLRLDLLREEVHRAVLRCIGARGERERLREYYAYMAALFREELSAALSPRTEALMQSLLE
jgi:ATP/maltotriose-dependent transcriptional regulator MalT/DNA-binding SARP family transcriptional activator